MLGDSVVTTYTRMNGMDPERSFLHEARVPRYLATQMVFTGVDRGAGRVREQSAVVVYRLGQVVRAAQDRVRLHA